MKRILLSAAFLAALYAPLSAMDGFSITNVWRRSWYAGIPEDGIPRMCDANMNVGAMIKINIQNNQVASTDTIISARTTNTQYSAIRLDGQKIAFFRWPYRINGTQLVNTNNGYAVAVCDINGGNITDIVSLPRRPGKMQPLDWPADGWIYYVMPSDVSDDPVYGEGYEVWKVNPNAVNPAFTNQRVMAVGPNTWRIWRFSVSLNGTRGAFDASCWNNCTGKINGAVNWPSGSGISGSAGACNAKICASGILIGSYGGGAHTEVNMASWNGSGYVSFPDLGVAERITWMQNHSGIYKSFQRAGFDMGSEAGCEMYTFACNSDKWYSEMVYWYYSGPNRGSNQLINNWHDMQSLFGTRNPKGLPNVNNSMDLAEGTFAWFATAGDVWVKPPAGTNNWSYEDTAGIWHSLTKPGDITGSTMRRQAHTVVSLLRAVMDRNGLLHIALPDDFNRYLVQVIDMTGRIIASEHAVGAALLNMPERTESMYILRIGLNGKAQMCRIIEVY